MTATGGAQPSATNITEVARWDEALRARTVTLPNARLDLAVSFLEDARSGDGWGIFPGAEVDRHSSAMAIAALRTALDDWMIKNSTVFFLEKYRTQVRGLGVDALIDVIELIKDGLPDEPELRKAISRRVKQHIQELVRDEHLGGIARLATLLVTGWPAGVIDQADAESGWQFLVSAQNTDGSWSAVRESGGTLTATAMALRALSDSTLDSGLGVRHNAFDFLAGRLGRLKGDDDPLGVFDLATTMLAIAQYDGCDYWLIASLEDDLLERQDQDGGWAELPDSLPTVEHTSLAVLALTAAGGRSHVPTRLAEAALEQARGRLGDVGEERDKLQAGFEKAVRERCGSLVAENERLKTDLRTTKEAADQVPVLEEQVGRLKRVAEPLVYSSELLAVAPLRVREYISVALALTGAVALFSAVGLVVSDRLNLNATSSVILFVVSILVAAFAVISVETRRRHNRRLRRAASTLAEQSYLQWLPFDRGSTDERLRALRTSFNRVLDDCAPPVRRELIYLLFDRFLDVPADVAGRLAEQTGMHLGMSADGAAHFRQWASAAALLEPSERQVLFDQIRRSVEL